MPKKARSERLPTHGLREALEVVYLGDGAVEGACKHVVGKRLTAEAIGYDLDSCRLLGHTGPADLLAQWTKGLILGAEASGGIELPTNMNRTRYVPGS